MTTKINTNKYDERWKELVKFESYLAGMRSYEARQKHAEKYTQLDVVSSALSQLTCISDYDSKKVARLLLAIEFTKSWTIRKFFKKLSVNSLMSIANTVSNKPFPVVLSFVTLEFYRRDMKNKLKKKEKIYFRNFVVKRLEDKYVENRHTPFVVYSFTATDSEFEQIADRLWSLKRYNCRHRVLLSVMNRKPRLMRKYLELASRTRDSEIRSFASAIEKMYIDSLWLELTEFENYLAAYKGYNSKVTKGAKYIGLKTVRENTLKLFSEDNLQKKQMKSLLVSGEFAMKKQTILVGAMPTQSLVDTAEYSLNKQFKNMKIAFLVELEKRILDRRIKKSDIKFVRCFDKNFVESCLLDRNLEVRCAALLRWSRLTSDREFEKVAEKFWQSRKSSARIAVLKAVSCRGIRLQRKYFKLSMRTDCAEIKKLARAVERRIGNAK